ncbi:MAG: glycerol kinase GlpK [Sphaerochaeta sp.]|jgi:glycerol kinase|nr:glycerol kinase GlpK [Sphaerochaeta sp.]MCH3919021.1 glycerol kinase GlpK [Sphaerochaeta sp.]MCI2044903.1 glycerol kinase GlpK [Sphaerochaeta sp.]MCI2075790.1 glycerol kinase GlpK [Sphaerochaeta sp.]MCI2096437.1 glycerol kinase GlpK [Sphaerochaeta sp.]
MEYIGALDQGTTSTRFILFDQQGEIVASHQVEHRQIYPQPGWVEHDPYEIWANACTCISATLQSSGVPKSALRGIGITNQRETIIAWNPHNGNVYHNAIVWQDLRGSQIVKDVEKKVSVEWMQKKTGLRISPYFSASKIVWLLRNVPGLKVAAQKGEVVFGTVDSWLIWNLTGGKTLVTDVTNASRTMLMNIDTLGWDDELLDLFGVPRRALPQIVPSCGVVYGKTILDGPCMGEVPVCGTLGDQQAALFGQACFTEGMGKSTYGTGCFLLVNTGEKKVTSKMGLITTVAYQMAGQKPRYALEGSIAVAGSLVQWARDNLKIVSSPQELDQLAMSVPDCGGVYIVPAFSGLFAPYWRSDARGVIAGLTGYVTRAHLCRAILEATAFQVNDIFEAMEMDSGIKMRTLKVDGGLTNSTPLMEFQSNLLAIPVIRPKIVETTALGAAYAAGLSVGVFQDFTQLQKQWQEERRWEPKMDDANRQRKIRLWRKAVSRTLGWKSGDTP